MTLILGTAENFFSYPMWWEGETTYHSAGVGDAGDAGGPSPSPLSHLSTNGSGGGQSRGGDGFSEPAWYFSCRNSAEFSRSSLHFVNSAFHIETSSKEGPCTSLHLWVGVYFQHRAIFTRLRKSVALSVKSCSLFFFYHF